MAQKVNSIEIQSVDHAEDNKYKLHYSYDGEIYRGWSDIDEYGV